MADEKKIPVTRGRAASFRVSKTIKKKIWNLSEAPVRQKKLASNLKLSDNSMREDVPQ